MTKGQACGWLGRAKKSGYVAYHSGLCCDRDNWYGVNIDGDGHDGRFFGCPKIIWSQEQAVDFFGGKFSPYK